MHIILIRHIIELILFSYIIYYILKLEKIGCECSQDWKRTFIKYFYIITIVYIFIHIISLFTNKFKLNSSISLIMMICNLLSIGIVYLYIHQLKKEKCECSKDQARDVLEIYNYILIALFIFFFTILAYRFIILKI
jgi:LytS/YehU family sensor histidine kinase